MDLNFYSVLMSYSKVLKALSTSNSSFVALMINYEEHQNNVVQMDRV